MNYITGHPSDVGNWLSVQHLWGCRCCMSNDSEGTLVPGAGLVLPSRAGLTSGFSDRCDPPAVVRAAGSCQDNSSLPTEQARPCGGGRPAPQTLLSRTRSSFLTASWTSVCISHSSRISIRTSHVSQGEQCRRRVRPCAWRHAWWCLGLSSVPTAVPRGKESARPVSGAAYVCGCGL